MQSATIAVREDDFPTQVLGSDLPVLVDFWAPWCGPCRVVGPILDEVALQYAGQLIVAKVNTDEDPEPAIRYGVRGIPTLVLFRGGTEVDRLVGALPRPALEQWIDRALAVA